jgi:hypothetical protein
MGIQNQEMNHFLWGNERFTTNMIVQWFPNPAISAKKVTASASQEG